MNCVRPAISRSVYRTLRPAAVVSVLAAAAAMAVPLSSTNSAYTLDLPDGFAEATLTPQATPDLIQSFVFRGTAGPEDEITLKIEPSLRSPSDAAAARRWERLLPPDMVVMDVYTEQWMNVDLDVLHARHATGDTNVVVHMVLVPLKPEPVQVSMEGPKSRDSETRGMMRTILQSLSPGAPPRDGRSPLEPPSDVHWAKAVWYLILVLAVALIGAGGLSWRSGGSR
jgi:hypothetical protein